MQKRKEKKTVWMPPRASLISRQKAAKALEREKERERERESERESREEVTVQH